MNNSKKEELVENSICRRVGVEEIIPLRHLVLREGLPITSASFDGDDKPDTFHFSLVIFTEGSNPLCCVSYMMSELDGKPALQLRGMATDPKFRGKNLGKTLLDFAENTIFMETGIKLFWCNAREVAIGFYEKQGWATVGDFFDIPTAGRHKKMVRVYK